MRKFIIFAIYKDRTILRLSQIHKLTIAIFAAVLMFFSPEAAAQNEQKADILNVICIDPGHGGHDPGCISGKTREKDLTLDISKRLASKLNEAFPEMTVVLTRSNDKYIGLGKRSQIANDAKADLFISIHINSAKNKSAAGFSIHCLGKSSNRNRDIFQENMDVCRRENAAVLLDDDKDEFFDPDDPASYMILSLMQNVYLEQSLKFAEEMRQSMSRHSSIRKDRGVWQDPFYVLSRTSMPAVLVECGFISNASDLQSLRSAEGREKIAESLFKAIKSYKSKYDREVTPADKAAEVPEANSEIKTEVNPEILYGTQILASGREIPSGDKVFKGYTPLVVKSGRLYKYIIGVDSDRKEAERKFKKIKQTFKESFMVSVKDNVAEQLKN